MKEIHIATYQDAAKPLANHLPSYDGHNIVIRLGGTMPYNKYDVQINSVDSINNSINKARQKNLLLNGGCKTLPILQQPEYPCVLKGIVRSCGTSVYVCNNKKEYDKAVRDLYARKGHIIEPLFEATSEYRLHCTRKEVFFSVKKIKRNPEDIIINHNNHYNIREFLMPRLWNEIKAECIKAMNVLDLDIACFDVMYSSKNNNKHEFWIAEANTNPELLKNTFDAYVKALDKLIREKIGAIPDIFSQIKEMSLNDILKIIKKLPLDIQKQFI